VTVGYPNEAVFWGIRFSYEHTGEDGHQSLSQGKDRGAL
jgi:hypothetical protein